MLSLPPPPTREELKTAQTLVNLHQGGTANDDIVEILPPNFEGPSVSSSADAMDKIVDRYDVNTPG